MYSAFLVLTVLILVAADASAGWTDSSSVNTPVCTVSNDQEFPAAVADGQGGVILAWSDKRAGPANADIYAQRIDAGGLAVWTPNGVPLCTAPGNQGEAVIAPDGDGGAIIVWSDQRSSDFDVYAQRVSRHGSPLWGPGGVLVSGEPGNQTTPDIAAYPTGGAVVVWRDERDDAGDIYAQRITADGVLAWAPIGSAISTAGLRQLDPAIEIDPFGSVFVVWTDERNGGDADIYVQRVTGAGTPLWGLNGAPLIALPEAHLLANLVSDMAGGVIVGWNDWRSSDQQLFAQRIDSTGTALWAAGGRYIGELRGNQLRVTIISDGAGGAVFAYQGDLQNDGIDIYAHRLGPSGADLWDSSGVMVADSNPNQTGLRFIRDSEGGFLVAWADLRNAPGWDIYAQRLDTSGVLQWSPSGVPVSTAPAFQQNFALVSDERGGGIAVWDDNRGGTDADIYAQRITSAGALPAAATISVHQGWNLVSLPREVGTVFVDSLFPGSQGKFAFNGVSYAPSDSLQAGIGIWAKFPSPALFELDGNPLDSVGVVAPGGNMWVLLGALTDPVPASALASDPPGAVQSGPYRYTDTGYAHTSMLWPGEAYWVFVNQPCVLTLSRP